ncbi:MAG TPA: FHA domain-containing protein [Sedimenticola thiotaurini]|uniref:FHA domain-containing protein n=1 Tax=Sedimenticola thiotaurini TaxID=1543721 RepID=A0A831W8T9_9GAMM|nr:FHA domain-containing protein [Sedimenticola thiotaurini]
MAKLTLFFRNRVVQVYHLDGSMISIGRSSDCEICIDTLALAERHAHVVPDGDGYLLTPFDEETPLLVNHQPVESRRLQHGDVIDLGKYSLHFAESAMVLAPAQPAAPPPRREQTEPQPAPELAIGCLQVMSGPNLGKVIPLQRALTRLALSPDGRAIVARRNDGYYLSHLEGQRSPVIQGQPIGELTVRLEDGNRLQVGDVELLFIEDITRAAAEAS